MKIGVIVPQGWTGEYDGWDAARGLASERADARPAGGPPRVRVDLAVRPLPHGSAPDRRDHLRVVHVAGGPGRGDRARPTRPHRHLHGVPQPGADGQDDLDDGRRSAAAGWSSGSAPAGSGTSGSRTATASPRRSERLARLGDDLEVSSPRCWPATGTSTRRSRASTRQRRERPQRPQADPAAARADHGRRQRAERHLAPGGPVRRRAQPRRDDARPRSRPRCPTIARAMRGDRPRPGDAWRSRSTSGRGARRGRDQPGRPAGRLPRGSASAGSWAWSRPSTTTDEALESLAEDARAAGVELA